MDRRVEKLIREGHQAAALTLLVEEGGMTVDEARRLIRSKSPSPKPKFNHQDDLFLCFGWEYKEVIWLSDLLLDEKVRSNEKRPTEVLERVLGSEEFTKRHPVVSPEDWIVIGIVFMTVLVTSKIMGR